MNGQPKSPTATTSQPLAKKSYRDILQEEVQIGWREMNRPGTGLFLSGLSAGLDIGFGLLLMAVLLTLGEGHLGPLLRKFLLAVSYSLGFVFVNLGRSELFTEHTTLMMFPFLSRNVTLRALGRVWFFVFIGNLLGAVVFAGLATYIGTAMHIIDPRMLAELAIDRLHYPWWVMVLSGILAGWLMGLLSWLVAATQDTMSQILCVGMITTTIGFANLHHCIAGSVEVLAGVFSDRDITVLDYGRFLLAATAGNILGGVIFASLKYSHAVRGHGK